MPVLEGDDVGLHNARSDLHTQCTLGCTLTHQPINDWHQPHTIMLISFLSRNNHLPLMQL
jgi:hypothetical protein